MVSACGGVVCMRLIVGSRDSMELMMFFRVRCSYCRGFWGLGAFFYGLCFFSSS